MISCRDYALKLISFKDRTEKEITDRLLRKGFSEEEAAGELAFLHEYGYINDESYAKRFAADAVNLKKWGKRRIITELVRRGIERTAAENAAEEVCTDTQSLIADELRRKFSGADLKDIKERRRIFAYFARRGFSPPEISGAMNAACAADDYDIYEE